MANATDIYNEIKAVNSHLTEPIPGWTTSRASWTP